METQITSQQAMARDKGDNMTGSPTVSVIVPNYNYARYLDGRMRSIFNQTFTDYEIILLDDASTDNSADILNKYATDPRVSDVVFNEKNSGRPFDQWKRGIDIARGRYVWIAEADDLSTPDFLRRAVNALEQNPDAVIAFSGSLAIDSGGHPLDMDYDRWDKHRYKKRNGKDVAHDGRMFVIHNQYWRCHVYNASGTVFRKSAFGDGSEFMQCFPMRNSGDWLFWSVMAAKGKVVEIYDKLNIIRRHDSNQTEKGMKNGNIYFDDLKVLRYIEDNFNVGRYRRMLRHALFYKRVKRSGLPDNLKQRIFAAMEEELGFTKREYIFDRIHKVIWHIFPFLLTMEKDRL